MSAMTPQRMGATSNVPAAVVPAVVVVVLAATGDCWSGALPTHPQQKTCCPLLMAMLRIALPRALPWTQF
jgi:hypothetical protein